MSNKEDKINEGKAYLKANVDIHLALLIKELLKKRPVSTEVVEFIRDWANTKLSIGGGSSEVKESHLVEKSNKNMKKMYTDLKSDDESSEEADEIDAFELTIQKKVGNTKNQKARASVSAESYGMFNNMSLSFTHSTSKYYIISYLYHRIL